MEQGSSHLPDPPTTFPQGSAQLTDQILQATGQPGPHRVPGHYFTSPGVPPEQQAAAPNVIVGPSTPLYVGHSICTAAIAGHDAQGNKIAITAGHCGAPGAPVASMDAIGAGKIGEFVRSGYPDYGVIKLHDDVQVSSSYGNVNITETKTQLPARFQNLCKTGISTGTSCGPFYEVASPYIHAHICGSHGDSGAPLYDGTRLVGIVNGGVGKLPSCTTPLQGPIHAPTAGAAWDVIQADLDAQGGVGAGFHLG